VWHKYFTKSLLSSDDQLHHNAAGGISMFRAESDDPSCLNVRGLSISRVRDVFRIIQSTDFQEIGYRSRYDNGWRYVNETLCSDHNASDDKTLILWTLTAGKDWYVLLVADEGNHLADFAAWCEIWLGPSTISISKADSSVESSQRKSPVTDGKTSETARSRSFAQAPRLHHNPANPPLLPRLTNKNFPRSTLTNKTKF